MLGIEKELYKLAITRIAAHFEEFGIDHYMTTECINHDYDLMDAAIREVLHMHTGLHPDTIDYWFDNVQQSSLHNPDDYYPIQTFIDDCELDEDDLAYINANIEGYRTAGTLGHKLF